MAVQKKSGLGRGLGALISEKAPTPAPVAAATPAETPAPAPAPEGGSMKVPITSIVPNPLQPRHIFNEEALGDLEASIRQHGVLSPLLVRKAATGYELISGERRLRASTAAGLAEVPVIIIDAPDVRSLEIALVENLQRENLNPIEEAEGYKQLAEQFHLTQEEIAERVGKARASVANAIRILGLPEDVRAMLGRGEIQTGHAKALLGVTIPEEQSLVARRVTRENLSVRKLEALIQRLNAAPRKPRAVKDDMPDTYATHLCDKLHTHFGTSVRLLPSRTFANGKKAKGSIEIDFYSNDDLSRILDMLGVSAE